MDPYEKINFTQSDRDIEFFLQQLFILIIRNNLVAYQLDSFIVVKVNLSRVVSRRHALLDGVIYAAFDSFGRNRTTGGLGAKFIQVLILLARI